MGQMNIRHSIVETRRTIFKLRLHLKRAFILFSHLIKHQLNLCWTCVRWRNMSKCVWTMSDSWVEEKESPQEWTKRCLFLWWRKKRVRNPIWCVSDIIKCIVFRTAWYSFHVLFEIKKQCLRWYLAFSFSSGQKKCKRLVNPVFLCFTMSFKDRIALENKSFEPNSWFYSNASSKKKGQYWNAKKFCCIISSDLVVTMAHVNSDDEFIWSALDKFRWKLIKKKKTKSILAEQWHSSSNRTSNVSSFLLYSRETLSNVDVCRINCFSIITERRKKKKRNRLSLSTTFSSRGFFFMFERNIWSDRKTSFLRCRW